MPYRDIQFAVGEFYHVVKKGIEGREIFLDEEDHLRFINSLVVFNDKKPAPWNMRAFWEQRDPSSLGSYMPQTPLLEIHAFALVKNHFHLLVRQLVESGLSDFIKKLGGYSYYFNKKYTRIGSLFQGRFKAVLLKTEDQLKNTFVYVNTNPLILIESNWKERGIKDFKKASEFLKEYKWSSYPDYLGEDNFPNIIKKEFFYELLGGRGGCREEVECWVQYKKEISEIKDIFLE